MTFQKSVNLTQAVGVPGQWASENPHSNLISNPGGWVAGSSGVTIGSFAWMDSTGTILSNSGTGAPSGFVGWSLQGVITPYLAEYGMTIPANMGVGDVFTAGDFFVVNSGTGTASIGMKAFANNSNGTISFAAAGATVAGSTETKWYLTNLQQGGTGAPGEVVVMNSLALG